MVKKCTVRVEINNDVIGTTVPYYLQVLDPLSDTNFRNEQIHPSVTMLSLSLAFHLCLSCFSFDQLEREIRRSFWHPLIFECFAYS